jgi:hypothetical protein
MFMKRKRARFHAPELITLRIESERNLQQMETASIARRIADEIELRETPCDGQTALRMFADRLDAQALRL